ncbi:hypothetical protein AVEN_126171-1 [Araneus ventricosus]|uniref:Uncharacterized protein n=1 Tax=Araneus ventricosus TaxID=182803 RepID=A0A4Y2FTX1_ARAVE|nr:hypothetical protein AVEN_126171-1 [Araneus ventricosus]
MTLPAFPEQQSSPFQTDPQTYSNMLSADFRHHSRNPHRKKIQNLQNQYLSIMTNAPSLLRNNAIHTDTQVKAVKNTSRSSQGISSYKSQNKNTLISISIEAVHNNGKYP